MWEEKENRNGPYEKKKNERRKNLRDHMKRKKKKKEMDYMKRNRKKEEERKSWTIWIMFQNVTDVQSKRRPKGPKVGNWPQKKNNFLLQNQHQQVLVVEKRLSCALGISGPSVFKYGTNNWPKKTIYLQYQQQRGGGVQKRLFCAFGISGLSVPSSFSFFASFRKLCHSNSGSSGHLSQSVQSKNTRSLL